MLVSAALSARGAPAEIIRRWLVGEFELLVSPLLLEELARVLSDPKIAKRIATEQAEELIELLRSEAELVPDPDLLPPVQVKDPGDEYLIALSSANAAALVSGDKHLTALSARLPVYTPADFLDGLPEISAGS